jgi:hypothetical protein
VVIVSSVAGMRIQSSHCIFWIQISTSITSQNFWNRGCFTFDIISKTMPKIDILWIKSKEILLLRKIIHSKHRDRQTEVRECFFLFPLLQTSLFVKLLKELAGAQRPKMSHSSKISQYFAMKRGRSAFFV